MALNETLSGLKRSLLQRLLTPRLVLHYSLECFSQTEVHLSLLASPLSPSFFVRNGNLISFVSLCLFSLSDSPFFISTFSSLSIIVLYVFNPKLVQSVCKCKTATNVDVIGNSLVIRYTIFTTLFAISVYLFPYFWIDYFFCACFFLIVHVSCSLSSKVSLSSLKPFQSIISAAPLVYLFFFFFCPSLTFVIRLLVSFHYYSI